jgi:hypothetical protein
LSEESTNENTESASDMPVELSTLHPSTIPFESVGNYVPYKQSRLRGHGNPLRPPFHVETVLIGRALGEQTGYLHGVGFRILNNGYVEAEFAEGSLQFRSIDEFRTELSRHTS